MSTEMFVKHLQLVVHKDGESDRYSGVAHVYVYGDVAIVDSVVGPGVLESLAERLFDLKELYGITRIEGFVLPSVFRAISRLTHSLDLELELGRSITYFGRTLVWMTIREKDKE